MKISAKNMGGGPFPKNIAQKQAKDPARPQKCNCVQSKFANLQSKVNLAKVSSWQDRH
jgi:hypothetical protein